MKLWLVTVHDKTTIDEVDVALSVVVGTEEDANACGRAIVDKYIEANRCRCVYHCREIVAGNHYRIGALIRQRRVP